MEVIKYPSREEWASLAQRPALDVTTLFDTVRTVLDEVRKGGDAAVIRYEEKFDKIYKLIGSISNNVNQIAVRVNSTDKIYAEDIVNIKEGQDKIWQLLNSLQSKLLRLKR